MRVLRLTTVCPAERLNVLITDWEAAEKDLKAFDEKGIQVVVVERPEKEQEQAEQE